MPRLINAENLVEYKASGVSDLTEWQKGWNDAIDTIMDEMPTVDAEPVKHGHWINKGYYAICSECGANSGTQYNGLEPTPNWSRYCSDCGAKMYEVKEYVYNE